MFSIIVPFYNSELSLRKCIDSILNQDFHEFELILLDDGSTDSSLSICREYEKVDSRVKVIPDSNHGVSVTRNKGISVAKGDYILFVDSDDELELDLLSKCKDKIDNCEADIYIFGYRQINLDLKTVIKHSSKEWDGSIYDFMEGTFHQLFNEWMIHSPWNKIYKKEIICSHKILFDVNYSIYEDIGFVLDYLSVCDRICVIDSILYNYMVKNSGSLVTKFHINAFLAYRDCWLKMKKLLYISDGAEFEEKYINFFSGKIFSYLRELYYAELSKEDKLKTLKILCNDKDIHLLVKASKNTGFHLKIERILIICHASGILYWLLNVMYGRKNR